MYFHCVAIISAWEKMWPFILKTSIPFYQKADLCQIWFELAEQFLRRRQKWEMFTKTMKDNRQLLIRIALSSFLFR